MKRGYSDARRSECVKVFNQSSLFKLSKIDEGQMFEAYHDPCLLLKGEATLPSPEKSPKKLAFSS